MASENMRDRKEYNKKYNLMNKKRQAENHRKYYLKNKYRLSEIRKKYNAMHKEHHSEIGKIYYLKNREKILQRMGIRSKNPETKKRIKIYLKKWYSKNRNKILRQCAEYRLKNKKKIAIGIKRWKLKNKNITNSYFVNRRKNDINFKMLHNIRVRISMAIRGYNKSAKTKELLGCSIEFLIGYLEAKFQPGMAWNNYGKNGWTVDHIFPCAIFNMSDPIEQKQCFHYTNLQPMWSKENSIKKDKIIYVGGNRE